MNDETLDPEKLFDFLVEEGSHRQDPEDHPSPETLTAYQANELSPEEDERIQGHLAACRHCTEMLLELEEFLAALGSGGSHGRFHGSDGPASPGGENDRGDCHPVPWAQETGNPAIPASGIAIFSFATGVSGWILVVESCSPLQGDRTPSSAAGRWSHTAGRNSWRYTSSFWGGNARLWLGRARIPPAFPSIRLKSPQKMGRYYGRKFRPKGEPITPISFLRLGF